MIFNPDSTKQAQKIIFCGKTSKRNHPSLTFNNTTVDITTTHKHLDLILDGVRAESHSDPEDGSGNFAHAINDIAINHCFNCIM